MKHEVADARVGKKQNMLCGNLHSAVFRSNKELPNLGFSFFNMHSKKEDTRDLVVLILDLSKMFCRKN